MLGILVLVIGISPHGVLVDKPNHNLCDEPVALVQPMALVQPVAPTVFIAPSAVPVYAQPVYSYRSIFRPVIRRGQFTVAPCTTGSCR